MAVFEQAQDATYSVAWIDCLGRGKGLGRSLVMLGEHAKAEALPTRLAETPYRMPARRRLSVPFDLPALTLNRYSLRAFNWLYYRLGACKRGQRLVDWDSYFYPLDAIQNWNRIYGRKGFAQFQCVLPLAQSQAGLTALLQAIASAGCGSFLAVLKRFGKQDSAFSFPMEGYTLALDFAVNARSLALLERLDGIVLAHGGRFYLAKDSRMRAQTQRAADPRITPFRAERDRRALTGRFRSALSERLSL